MKQANPVLEEYENALLRGDRTFGVLLYPEDLTCLKELGLDNYETEPANKGRLYVKVYIPIG